MSSVSNAMEPPDGIEPSTYEFNERIQEAWLTRAKAERLGRMPLADSCAPPWDRDCFLRTYCGLDIDAGAVRLSRSTETTRAGNCSSGQE